MESASSLELKNTRCRAVIFPYYGGLVNNFFVKNTSGVEEDFLYGYDNEGELNDLLGSDFRGIKLSPYPNRIQNGEFHFEGEVYQLDHNFPQEGNSIHGFLFDQPFVVHEHRNDSLVLRYTVRKNAFQGYPFSYDIEIIYKLLDCGISFSTTIINRDNQSIPIGDGFHPYFKIGDSIDELELKLPTVCKMRFSDSMELESSEEFNDFQREKSLKGYQFDDCFEILEGGKNVEVVIKNKDRSISIKQDIGIDKYNFLQIYTPPHRKSIAIEPMTCAPNGFNNDRGLITLKEGETIQLNHEFSIEVG